MTRVLGSLVALALVVAGPGWSGPASGQGAGPIYVAMGDSVASGEGVPPFEKGTDTEQNDCHRSLLAYPRLFAASRPGLRLVHVGCSGGTVAAILSERLSGEPAQVEHLSADTAFITVTVGGNDIGFVPILLTCYVSPACHEDFTRGGDEIGARIEHFATERLPLAYSAIRARSPSARVVFTGYPHLFPMGPNLLCVGLSMFERRYLREKTRELNAGIETFVAGARVAGDERVVFLPLSDEFAGREACTLTPLINGLSFPVVYSYHPNAEGQQVIADALARLVPAPAS